MHIFCHCQNPLAFSQKIFNGKSYYWVTKKIISVVRLLSKYYKIRLSMSRCIICFISSSRNWGKNILACKFWDWNHKTSNGKPLKCKPYKQTCVEPKFEIRNSTPYSKGQTLFHVAILMNIWLKTMQAVKITWLISISLKCWRSSSLNCVKASFHISVLISLSSRPHCHCSRHIIQNDPKIVFIVNHS